MRTGMSTKKNIFTSMSIKAWVWAQVRSPEVLVSDRTQNAFPFTSNTSLDTFFLNVLNNKAERIDSHFFWNLKKFTHVVFQLHEWRKGNHLKSKMEIDPATQADAGIYECHANNKYAVDTKAFRTTYIAQFN